MEPAGEAELDATYYDTPGLVLLGAGVTLRRRAGGADEGWHLKLPTGVPEARREQHAPLGDGPERPPAELLDQVAGWTRGIAVAPVARIRTRRTTYRLVGPDGRVLAELADDRVTGQPAQLDAATRAWREWEVELVDGDPELLDIVEAVLAAHDVHRSPVTRKIALVLDAETGPAEPPAALRRRDPARLLLHRWLAAQVQQLATLDPVVRRGDPGGVHGTRKACRRLRSALATYRPLLDREVTDPLRDELRWLARSLGQARDDEVVVERLARQLDAEADADGLAPAARTLLDQYAAGRAGESAADTAVALDSTRYFALRTALDALVADPPWTEEADLPGARRPAGPAREGVEAGPAAAPRRRGPPRAAQGGQAAALRLRAGRAGVGHEGHRTAQGRPGADPRCSATRRTAPSRSSGAGCWPPRRRGPACRRTASGGCTRSRSSASATRCAGPSRSGRTSARSRQSVVTGFGRRQRPAIAAPSMQPGHDRVDRERDVGQPERGVVPDLGEVVEPAEVRREVEQHPRRGRGTEHQPGQQRAERRRCARRRRPAAGSRRRRRTRSASRRGAGR